MDCEFVIGGIPLRISGVRWDVAAGGMPENFRPFAESAESAESAEHSEHSEYSERSEHSEHSDSSDNSDHGGCLRVVGRAGEPSLAGLAPLSTSFNDLGQASLYRDVLGGWLVALIPVPGQAPRIMRMDADFRQATVWLDADDRYYDFVMDSMTRIYFSQYAATRHALMLHASVVECLGMGFLFMGESGVGKSTHSRLWRETFPGCELLNDDCPLVVADGRGGFAVCGTPWSGKTPCYRNHRCPVGGIVRLRQAPENRFIPQDGIQAFVSFIPGMSVMTSARGLYSEATTTALELLYRVPFGVLECRPDAAAAHLCRASLTTRSN